MNSWKTTSAGFVAIVGALALIMTGLGSDDGLGSVDWNAAVPQLIEGATALLIGLGLLAARDNDRTSGETGAADKAAGRRAKAHKLPSWLVVFALLPALMFAGCASSAGSCVERKYDAETGNLIEEFEYKQKGITTAGSKQEESNGSLAYTGEGWSLAVGNNAVGQQAGDGVEALTALLSIAPVLAPFLQAPADTGPSTQEVLLELIRELRAGAPPP